VSGRRECIPDARYCSRDFKVNVPADKWDNRPCVPIPLRPMVIQAFEPITAADVIQCGEAERRKRNSMRDALAAASVGRLRFADSADWWRLCLQRRAAVVKPTVRSSIRTRSARPAEAWSIVAFPDERWPALRIGIHKRPSRLSSHRGTLQNWPANLAAPHSCVSNGTHGIQPPFKKIVQVLLPHLKNSAIAAKPEPALVVGNNLRNIVIVQTLRAGDRA